MELPDYNLEKTLISQGFLSVCGADEAGRGAWAGPLVAGAAIIIGDPQAVLALGVRDSKLLSEEKREEIFERLNELVIFASGLVTAQEIDSYGLQTGNITAVKRAIDGLTRKPDYLLIDRLVGFSHDLPQQNLISADSKILSVACASIVAKVTRDRIMRELDQQYPDFGFSEHKGYGTAKHLQALKSFGCLPIHRFSYKPVREINQSK
jgi:ribonuclease HII